MSLLFVLNSFMRNRKIAKSNDRISDSDKKQTSVAYRSTGMHLLSTKWRTTSSEARQPTFPKTAFTERQKERLASSKEHFKFLELTKKIPRYLIVSTHGKFWLPATILEHTMLYLGPTRIQADFFAFINISK